MNELKERLEQLIEETKQELINIYLPHDTVLLLSGKRLGLEIAANIIGVLPEQPVTDCHELEQGLEEEIDKYCQPIQAWEVQEAPFTSLEECARHFAEWGAIHLNARKEEK